MKLKTRYQDGEWTILESVTNVFLGVEMSCLCLSFLRHDSVFTINGEEVGRPLGTSPTTFILPISTTTSLFVNEDWRLQIRQGMSLLSSENRNSSYSTKSSPCSTVVSSTTTTEPSFKLSRVLNTLKVLTLFETITLPKTPCQVLKKIQRIRQRRNDKTECMISVTN